MFVNSADCAEPFFSRCTACSQSGTSPTPFHLWQILYQPRFTLRYIEKIRDDNCLLEYDALSPAVKWPKSQKICWPVFTAEYHDHTSLKMIVVGYFETSNICQPLPFTPLKVAGSLLTQSLVKLISQNIQIFCCVKHTSFVSRAEKFVGLQNEAVKSF